MRVMLGVLVVAFAAFASVASAVAAETGRLRHVATITTDAKGTRLRDPEGVACNDKSVLVVGDTGHGRLLRYTVEDRDVKLTGEMQAPQVSVPIRVQINSKDEVFALDGRERRIGRFDAKGQFAGYVNPEGVPAPTSLVVRAFKIDRSDAMYLLDVFGARVLVLDAAGTYQRHLPLPADSGFFSDLAVDPRGAVYVVDSVKAALYVATKDSKAFSPLGKNLRAHMNFPTSLAVDGRGVLWVVDQNGAGVVLIGQDGAVLGRQLAMGRTDGLLYYPSQLCLNDKGQVVIADRGNSRVQLFSVAR